MFFFDAGKPKCFACGETGYFKYNCPKTNNTSSTSNKNSSSSKLDEIKEESDQQCDMTTANNNENIATRGEIDGDSLLTTSSSPHVDFSLPSTPVREEKLDFSAALQKGNTMKRPHSTTSSDKSLDFLNEPITLETFKVSAVPASLQTLVNKNSDKQTRAHSIFLYQTRTMLSP